MGEDKKITSQNHPSSTALYDILIKNQVEKNSIKIDGDMIYEGKVRQTTKRVAMHSFVVDRQCPILVDKWEEIVKELSYSQARMLAEYFYKGTISTDSFFYYDETLKELSSLSDIITKYNMGDHLRDFVFSLIYREMLKWDPYFADRCKDTILEYCDNHHLHHVMMEAILHIPLSHQYRAKILRLLCKKCPQTCNHDAIQKWAKTLVHFELVEKTSIDKFNDFLKLISGGINHDIVVTCEGQTNLFSHWILLKESMPFLRSFKKENSKIIELPMHIYRTVQFLLQCIHEMPRKVRYTTQDYKTIVDVHVVLNEYLVNPAFQTIKEDIKRLFEKPRKTLYGPLIEYVVECYLEENLPQHKGYGLLLNTLQKNHEGTINDIQTNNKAMMFLV